MILLLRRMRLRYRLASGFGMVCLLILVMSWVGVSSANLQAEKTSQVGALQILTRDVMQLKFRGADISQWQTAYAWDVPVIGGKAATDTTSPNRTGFNDGANALERELGAVHTEDLTSRELELFNQVKTGFAAFLENDKKVIALFQQETLDTMIQANELIVGTGFTEYSQIQTAVNKLTRSLKQRSDAAQTSANNAATQARWVLIVGSLLALILAVAISVAITRSIVVPAQRVMGGLRQLAGKDLTRTLPVIGHDEMTAMATAFNQTVDSMRCAILEVGDRAGSLTDSAHQLMDLSSGMDDQASSASREAAIVNGAAGDIATNAHVIASASEQMTASIKEVSRSTSSAATVASAAVSTADITSERVKELTIASSEIGQIVTAITAITEQTNLLALNATIEAARAGEAGRGFAIVANEVKELAHQTSEATVDITDKIAAIQSTTGRTASSIAEIADVVREISGMQAAVATVVEQQTATSAEINRNLSGLVSGSDQIAGGINEVANTAAATSGSASEARQAAHDLQDMAGALRELVSSFRC